MKYQLWSDKSINEMTSDAEKVGGDIVIIMKQVTDLIEVANTKHNEKMLEKDIIIAGLEGQLK